MAPTYKTQNALYRLLWELYDYTIEASFEEMILLQSANPRADFESLVEQCDVYSFYRDEIHPVVFQKKLREFRDFCINHSIEEQDVRKEYVRLQCNIKRSTIEHILDRVPNHDLAEDAVLSTSTRVSEEIYRQTIEQVSTSLDEPELACEAIKQLRYFNRRYPKMPESFDELYRSVCIAREIRQANSRETHVL